MHPTVRTAIAVVGDRAYRIAGATATQLLGGERADVVQLLVEGDPDQLDELALAAETAHGHARTQRGRQLTPRVSFVDWQYPIELYVVSELPPAVEILYHGETLTVCAR